MGIEKVRVDEAKKILSDHPRCFSAYQEEILKKVLDALAEPEIIPKEGTFGKTMIIPSEVFTEIAPKVFIKHKMGGSLEISVKKDEQ